MPNKNFNDLTIATTTDGTELVPVVSSGVTSAISVSNINSGIIADTISDVTNADDLSVGQSSIAAGVSSLVSSITQQDLSGVNTVALHRNSAAAVTSMFIYDTSKDSDGGAWTEKCQHTSWYNEPLSGKWLGAQASEFYARTAGASYGANILVNSDFSVDASGFETILGATLTAENGLGKLTSVSGTQYAGILANFSNPVGVVLNVLYEVSVDVYPGTYTGVVDLAFDGANASDLKTEILSSGATRYTSTIYLIAALNSSNGRRMRVRFNSTHAAGQFVYIDNLRFRQIVSQTTQSNDYYQSTANGKFYRLWKNLLSYSEQFDNSYWPNSIAGSVKNSTVLPNTVTTTDPIGSYTADKLIANTTNAQHFIGGNNFGISGSFTGSVYVKAGEYTKCGLSLRPGGPYIFNTGAIPCAVYDFAAVSSTSYMGASSTITGVGNGWYRITISHNSLVDLRDFVVVLLDNTGSSSFAGDNSSGIYIWGAQLETGLTATTYEPKGIEGSTSEVFRGNKREFPKLSALISESDNTTIYDLTEPNRPMWMRMTTSMFPAFEASGGYIPALSSANGTIGFSRINGGNVGEVWLLNFVRDIVYARGSTLSSYNATYINGNIADRLKYQRNLQYVSNSGYGFIIPSFVIIKPPVKPLKIQYPVCDPIVYIQHEGGISVIRDDMVRISNGVAGYWPSFTQTNARGLFYHHTSTGANAQFIPQIETAAFTQIPIPTTSYPDFIRATPSRVVGANDRFVAATSNRVGLLKINEQGGALKSTGAIITNTYNTGHQLGDIRRTYLSDVDAGSVSSTELIPDGTFDIGISEWTNQNAGTVQWTGSALRIISNGSLWQKVYKIIPTRIGARYNIKGSITGTSSNTSFEKSDDLGLLVNRVTFGTSGTYTVNSSFVATATQTYIILHVYNRPAGEYGDFDNISVIEVVSDRSYKASAATITGTLTKTQVATGSQLVAYSGFSA